MKQLSLISMGVLLLFLGSIAPASAKQDQYEQGSQAQKQEQQPKPEGQQQAKPAEQKQAKPEAQQQKPQQQAGPAKQEQQQPAKAQPQQAKAAGGQQQHETQSAKQPQEAKSQQQTAQNNQQKKEQAKNPHPQTSQVRQQPASSRPPQRTAEAQTRQRAEPALRLSAVSSSRIPAARFQSNFGRSHEFHIGSPRMVGGYSRFQYGGYWFGFVQPWPDNWYYTDNVYVDYIGGQYYLCNPYYPGARVSISVVL